MAELDQEIAAFEEMREDLLANHEGKWVLIHKRDFVGAYDSFDAAANAAVSQFGRGPYLIRQVGAPPVILPASAMYTYGNARD